jgi:hypothetical protein
LIIWRCTVRMWTTVFEMMFLCVSDLASCGCIYSIYTVLLRLLFACFPVTSVCVCVCVIECKHWKRKEPVNYCIYVQCYCHPTLYFGCNRKYYFVFLFCSFQFNASEIVIDYTRDTGNKWLTGRRRLKVVELFTN